MTMTDPISPAQANFIASLLSTRLSTLGFATVQDAERALNLDQATKGTASVLIERLKGMPTDPDPHMPDLVAHATRKGTGNRPGNCAACGHLVAQGAGYYFLANDGRWAVHHKVGECSSAPVPAPVALTEGLYMAADGTVVKVYTTRNGRLAGKVLIGSSFRYQQGAASIAATGHKLTAEEAAEYGRTTGHCVNCGDSIGHGDTVSTLVSLAQGYGPVCAKRNGWPTMTVEQAKAALLAAGVSHPLLVDKDACSGGTCSDINHLCSKHQADYQRRHGRASNE